jgi:hypothetical protein
MPTVGVCLTAVGVVYWLRLQASPRFVVLRAANAIYGTGSLDAVEFHPDELQELGLDHDEAVAILRRIREQCLPDVRMASAPEFRKQPGRDVLSFRAEMRPGVFVDAVIEVIDEDGRGVLLFGDLVSSYRASLYRAEATGAAREQNFAALNGIREILIGSGVKGYWDITRNRFDAWPQYSVQGERVQAAGA